jgi:hypothetical protein
VRAAGVNRRLVFVDVPDDAFLVHYKRGAVGEAAFFVEDPVLLGDGSLEIAEEWVSDLKLLGILLVGKPAVDTDAENLSVGLLEFGDISLIRLELLRSTTCKRQNVKRQDDVPLPPEFAELDFFPFRVQ